MKNAGGHKCPTISIYISILVSRFSPVYTYNLSSRDWENKKRKLSWNFAISNLTRQGWFVSHVQLKLNFAEVVMKFAAWVIN